MKNEPTIATIMPSIPVLVISSGEGWREFGRKLRRIIAKLNALDEAREARQNCDE